MHRPFSTLVSVLAVASASIAGAQVPDPSLSTCPSFVYIVGRVANGDGVDPVGLGTITLRDFANNPRVGVPVTLDFSGCCDLALCGAESNGQPLEISGQQVTGVTNDAGQFSFTMLGSARDPGTASPPAQHGGCGERGVTVRAPAADGGGIQVVCTISAVCLDQNGAAGGSNGTTISDVANLLNLFGSVSLGAPYRSRGDINADGNITIGDVGSEMRHLGRLALAGGVGCTEPFALEPACP
jgi:hypothetical protein